MKKETKIWLDFAEEDFKNIKAMLDDKSLRAAVFFAQQSVEKIIKAYIIEFKNKQPKKTHRIEVLLKESGLDTKEISQLPIEELSKAYIWVRYPDLSRKFYSKKEITDKLIVCAIKIYQWMKKKFKKN